MRAASASTNTGTNTGTSNTNSNSNTTTGTGTTTISVDTTISSTGTYIVINDVIVTLSNTFQTGEYILIINLTDTYIRIKTSNRELIYHVYHSLKTGLERIYIEPKLSGKFLYINNGSTNFWNVNLA